MVTTSLIIAAAVIIAVILLVLLVLWIRSRRFRPSADKMGQQRELNEDLEETGFAYEMKGDYFYSLMNCWQREAGYCRLYDEAAPLFNMIMDCEPVTFNYAGKRWLIELWKGQYGITTGGEIGIYNTERDDIDTDKFKGTFYENIRNDEMLKMSFILRRNGRIILRRSAVHWWLTGFKLGQFSQTDNLTMDAKITFPDNGMRDAFVESLTGIGYQKKEFSVRRRTVVVHYTQPHTVQTESRNKVSETLVQQTNNSNCKLYEFATGKYSDTLDKLEYAKAMVPELYTIFIQSLYARGIYEAFEWIKEWLEGRHPDPGPVPPKPPYPPCPPKPPVPPCPPKPPVPPCPPEPPCCPCPPCPPRQECTSRPSCPPRLSCLPRPECSSGSQCNARPERSSRSQCNGKPECSSRLQCNARSECSSRPQCNARPECSSRSQCNARPECNSRSECSPWPQYNLNPRGCQDYCSSKQKNQNHADFGWQEEENQESYFNYEEQTSVFEFDDIEDTEEFQEEEFSDRPWR